MVVPFTHIYTVADKIGCDATEIPFIHLGVPVGQNMTRVFVWTSVFDRFHTRILGWKAKCLFVGGRVTLVKYILGS